MPDHDRFSAVDALAAEFQRQDGQPGLPARQFRMAAAWAGRCRLGALRAGDGETTATTEIDGETGRLVLAISIDPAAPLLQQVDLLVQP